MPTSKEDLLRRGLKLHDIQHNQHRRAEWQDYGSCGLYMITLCIDGRHPFFGYLEGNIKAIRGTTDFPHIVLSTLGRTILENELPQILRLYPQIEIWQAAIMPDHLHLLLYIREPLPQGKHLGHIISSFKGGCSRAWWAQTATGKTDANATEAPSDYARFHRLNDLAEEICNTTGVTLLNMTGIAWRWQGPVPCQPADQRTVL